MLCQKCGKNAATSHIHFVLNGVVRDTYLCSECAKNSHNSELHDSDVFKMLSSLLNDGAQPAAKTLKCECCGADFNEIRRTGRVGCGNCYKTFEKQLAPTLVRLHGRTAHVGKKPCAEPVPEAKPAENTKEQRVEELKQQLADAIAREEYEKAAVIRDEIRNEEA